MKYEKLRPTRKEIEMPLFPRETYVSNEDYAMARRFEVCTDPELSALYRSTGEKPFEFSDHLRHCLCCRTSNNLMIDEDTRMARAYARSMGREDPELTSIVPRR